MHRTAIRFRPLRSLRDLAGVTRHANRMDELGRARVRLGAVPGAGLAWAAHGCNPRDVSAAWKAHKAATGAAERKNAPLALQVICVVSPAWIRETGDLHDPANPRNRALARQARAWAESWAGSGSVVAARLDLDERGGGVVDLTIVPVRTQRSRGGRETVRISTNGALTELAASVGEQKSYSAAQTSWAAWAQRTLDPALQRGVPRSETTAQHLAPEAYGRVQDELRDAAARLVATRNEAERLVHQGREWIADVRSQAEAERDRLLAPVRTWRDRTAFLRRQEEAQQKQAIDLARAAGEATGRVAASPERDRLTRAEARALAAEGEAKELRARVDDLMVQRDAAHQEVQRLKSPDLASVLPFRSRQPRM